MGVEFKLTESKAGVAILAITGEMDMGSSPDIREKLTGLFKKDHNAIVVDLAGVPYIDSSGIATLVEGLQWGHGKKRKFRLAGMQAAVKDVFEIARLLTIFETFATLEEALKGV